MAIPQKVTEEDYLREARTIVEIPGVTVYFRAFPVHAFSIYRRGMGRIKRVSSAKDLAAFLRKQLPVLGEKT